MLSPTLHERYERLQQILREMGSLAIGYSGGVDSTLLLKVAVDLLGGRVLAMIGRSATYPTREFEEATALASSIGARTIVVDTEETDVVKFRENPPDRCYYCKTELFGKLEVIARREGIPWIADGTIVDDTGDFRPGMRAKGEHQVRSPLLEAEMTKADVRELSRHLGLPTWDKPSFACLSSRFPYGTGITTENLTRVDRAETLLRDEGFRFLRVRFHDPQTARIEVGPQELSRILDDAVRSRIIDSFKNLGFTYVTLDLQGYRTGSMNEVLSHETKQQFLR
jgi:pyridinium-3,5-biscarboxylic acid mononucleotide sulfurtransferase